MVDVSGGMSKLLEWCFSHSCLNSNDQTPFAVSARWASASHVARAPPVLKCQLLRGLSWPVEPQLVTLPTLSLKETDFYQTPPSCKEGQAWHLANVFIYLFCFSKAFALVPGVMPQRYTGSNGPRRRVNTSARLQKRKRTWCVAFDPTCGDKSLPFIWGGNWNAAPAFFYSATFDEDVSSVALFHTFYLVK